MNAVTVLSVTQDRRDRLVESQRNLQSKKKLKNNFNRDIGRLARFKYV